MTPQNLPSCISKKFMKTKLVVKNFYAMPRKKQEELLTQLYSYSKDIKLFMDSRLGLSADTDSLVLEMERETIGKVYRKGTPATPNGKTVNAIIAKAQKAGVGFETMLELERSAYRGFTEFLNEYGGGPESFDEMACNHLEAYLLLVKRNIKDNQKQQIMYEEVRIYLRKLHNMITDYVDETFEEVTGILIGR